MHGEGEGTHVPTRGEVKEDGDTDDDSSSGEREGVVEVLSEVPESLEEVEDHGRVWLHVFGSL